MEIANQDYSFINVYMAEASRDLPSLLKILRKKPFRFDREVAKGKIHIRVLALLGASENQMTLMPDECFSFSLSALDHQEETPFVVAPQVILVTIEAEAANVVQAAKVDSLVASQAKKGIRRKPLSAHRAEFTPSTALVDMLMDFDLLGDRVRDIHWSCLKRLVVHHDPSILSQSVNPLKPLFVRGGLFFCGHDPC